MTLFFVLSGTPGYLTLTKELEKAGLLYQKAMHFNPKTGKNEPNRLYLAELDMQSTDVYLRGEYAQKEPQTLVTGMFNRKHA